MILGWGGSKKVNYEILYFSLLDSGSYIFRDRHINQSLASSERGDLERVKDPSPSASVKTSAVPPTSLKENNTKLFHKGVLALNKGDNQQAVQFFSAWTKTNPRSTAGWFNLGLSFYRETQSP